MGTYMDKEAFIKEIVKIDPRRLSTKTIGEALDRIPAADVVEVVRCKDCKYRRKLDIIDVCEHDKIVMVNESNPKRVHVLAVGTEHYCGYAERKEQ